MQIQWTMLYNGLRLDYRLRLWVSQSVSRAVPVVAELLVHIVVYDVSRDRHCSVKWQCYRFMIAKSLLRTLYDVAFED